MTIKGVLRMVDTNIIEIPEIRVTNYIPEDLAEEFAKTVETLGVVEPPICIEHEGRLVCVDGRNRIEQAQAANLRRIQVVVRPGDMQEVLMLNLITATMRGRPRLGEMVRVISELHHNMGVGTEDLVKRTGLTQRFVDDLLVIWEAGPAVMMAIDDGQIAKTHALLLAAVKSPEMRDRLLMSQLSYHYSADQLKQVIREAERYAAGQASEAAPAPVEPPPPVPCHFCGVPLRPTELVTWAMCPACNAVAMEFGASRRQALPPEGGP